MMEIDEDTLSEIISNKTSHRRIRELGERVWIAEGKECDVIYGMRVMECVKYSKYYQNLKLIEAAENE